MSLLTPVWPTLISLALAHLTSINVESTTVVNFSPAVVDACQESNNLR
jgi:hypothetical protein